MSQCIRINNKKYCQIDESNAKQSMFKQRCDSIGGIAQWAPDGVLLNCVEPITIPGQEYTTLFSEINPVHQDEHMQLLSQMDTEKERLVWYFHTVYPNTTDNDWRKFTVQQLMEFYRSLEIYYDLPSDFDPRTPITIRRMEGTPKFYRVPEEVEVEQKLRDGGFPDDSWVEVVHFGPMNLRAYLPNADYYSGNYYYPVRGSGVYINVGKSLIAWNKVHALKILGVPNEKILELSGNTFRMWLKHDTKTILQNYPNLGEEEARRQALAMMIDSMVKGYSLRQLPNSDVIEYFGVGGSTTGADAYLALMATAFDYDSIQLVREAQLRPSRDVKRANVGFELIDLRVPSVSAKKLFIGYRPSANGL